MKKKALIAGIIVVLIMVISAFADTPASPYHVSVDVALPGDAVDRNLQTPEIDLYAGDTVNVSVRITGGDFAAAHVTLTYDSAYFAVVSSPVELWTADGNTFQFHGIKTAGSVWEEGTVIGTFTFRALAAETPSSAVSFSVSGSPAYVVAQWAEGWSEGDGYLPSANISNASVGISLMDMLTSVTTVNNLSYKGDNTPQKLVKDGFKAYATLTGEEITSGLTIRYAVTAAGAAAPAKADYTTVNPGVTAAGDYILYYYVSCPGYEDAFDYVNVSIAKASVTLSWSLAQFDQVNSQTKDQLGGTVTEDYYRVYNGAKFDYPVATYIDLTTNASADATVSMTSSPSDGFKKVGSYRFTAEINGNYSITNPIKTARIDGAIIQGYTLTHGDEGDSVWRDGASHIPGDLTVSDTHTANVTVMFSLDGETWQNSIPGVSAVKKYILQMKLTAEGHYEQIQQVEFEIKGVEFKTEKSDYVMGWDLLLVYTNAAVPGFKYNGTLLYDVTELGYCYGSVWEGKQLVDSGVSYAHVYGLVVKGNADKTKVVPSNVDARTIDRSNALNRFDVNNSHEVEINDLVAVQAIYNVRSDYLSNEMMALVLQADVSGDRKVDTIDCSLIKINSHK